MVREKALSRAFSRIVACGTLQQMKPYDHNEIEGKWQALWEETGMYRADDASQKQKKYVLDMYPYPSGAGLHVGHVEGYTATDIYTRHARMQGYEVLHPMGWDAFGLPAENYAVKTGVPPQTTTQNAIDTFRRQIKALGLSYDWTREVGSHTPEYYQWTQWFFLLLYKNGLAEKKKAKVNWCPSCQTVLANEQVVDGKCERCGTEVMQKDLEQWFFKITEFADALADDLDAIDWPESTKAAQRNWIGRSEGAEIDFKLTGGTETVTVFTTRPDTLFGATYLVLAPEHPLVASLQGRIENAADVQTYIEATQKKTDLERQEDAKDKTGVELIGVKATNPANGEEIPVWIADYVIGTYGTGAIMAVPAHDERDHEFAVKMGLPIREVIVPNIIDKRNPPIAGKNTKERQNVHAIVYEPKSGKYLGLKWKQFDWTTFPMGGVEDGEDVEAAARREVQEETGYIDLKLIKVLPNRARAEYFAAHKDENRISYTTAIVFELASDARVDVDEAEGGQHDTVWLDESMLNYEVMTHAEIGEWQRQLAGIELYTGGGILVDSGAFSGMTSDEAKRAITKHVGGRMKTTYRLRDWLVSRQRYWGAPIPIVYDPEGKPHPIPEEHLPWLLPTDVEFKPTGVSPLSLSEELKERTEKIFGKGWAPEVDTMDTFVCSSWYFFRFADPKNVSEFAGKGKIAHWLPVDLYVGGAEHTVLHLLYSRFFTKVLQKLGFVSFGEPFQKLRHQGIILAEDGRKMSKSLGNVVNPDDVIELYGADTLRVYEMFMGPLEIMKPWSTQNIIGARRFLERAWRLAGKVGETHSEETECELHKTIKKVGEDIAELKFNTAISQMMIFVNSAEEKGITKAQYQTFLKVLAPFAPHMTEELWHELGNTTSIHTENWPHYDEAKLIADTITIAVQVNGKLRATIDVPAEISDDELKAGAKESVAKWLQGDIKKEVVVPGRLVNFVVV